MRHVGLVAACLACLSSANALVPPPSPPKQPAHGPGSSDYAYANITSTHYGEGDAAYWIFAPEKAKAPLPVVIFNHGWSAMDPAAYGAWINHIVRRGALVIYPVWQKNLSTSPKLVTYNATEAVKSALTKLGAKADLTHIALLGHSMGGIISANMAAEHQLPEATALMIVEPGKTWKSPRGGDGHTRIVLANMQAIHKDMLMLVVVGEDDYVAQDRDAKTIFRNTAMIRPENKNYILIHSDRHGKPWLIANHSAPATRSPAQASALQFYGYWKLFDALTDAAFFHSNQNIALGDTYEQRFMGIWSDGTAVTPLSVTLAK